MKKTVAREIIVPVRPRGLSFLILVAGIILTILGLILGEPQRYFFKAIQVCTECIGIG